jgi:hypothetical protein
MRAFSCNVRGGARSVEHRGRRGGIATTTTTTTTTTTFVGRARV